MEEKLKAFFGWIRAVRINNDLVTDYTDKDNVLLNGDKDKKIADIETFVLGLMTENTRVNDLRGVQAAQLVKLQDRITELELSQERLLKLKR